LIARAREIGLNRIAVTDHNTIEGALEAHRLAPDLVLVGEEIVTETGGELIAYFVQEAVPPHLPGVCQQCMTREQTGKYKPMARGGVGSRRGDPR